MRSPRSLIDSLVAMHAAGKNLLDHRVEGLGNLCAVHEQIRSKEEWELEDALLYMLIGLTSAEAYLSACERGNIRADRDTLEEIQRKIEESTGLIGDWPLEGAQWVVGKQWAETTNTRASNLLNRFQ